MKTIYQDVWFQQWMTRKDEILSCRFIEYAWVLRHLGVTGCSILDVGCGASWFPLLLALQGYDVTATDLHNFDYKFPYYRFVQSEVTTFTSDKHFDYITVVSTMEHFGIQQQPLGTEEDRKAIHNLNTFLDDDGIFLVTVPYGHETMLPEWRVYTQERLASIFPRIHTQDYFIRDGNYLVKCSREQAAQTVHRRGEATAGLTCFTAGKAPP